VYKQGGLPSKKVMLSKTLGAAGPLAMPLTEEDSRVRTALRSDLVLSPESLCGALHRSHAAVQEAHRLATQLWRSPLSLFDGCAKHAGVPRWSVDAVQRAKLLVQEAARLGRLVETYGTQVNMAKRDHRGIARQPVLVLLDQLDSLARDLREHLSLLQAARSSFDTAKEAWARTAGLVGCHVSATSSTATVIQPKGDSDVDGQPTCSEVDECGKGWALRELAAALDGPQGSSTVQEDVEDILEPRRPVNGAALWHRLPRMLDTSLSSFTTTCTTLRQITPQTPPVVRAAEADVAMEHDGALVHADEEIQTPINSWTRTRGQASPWLALIETAEECRHRDMLSNERWLLTHSQDQSTENRWKRCRRRSDRRWSLP